MREGRNTAKSLELSQNILKVIFPGAKNKKIVFLWDILFTTGAMVLETGVLNLN